MTEKKNQPGDSVSLVPMRMVSEDSSSDFQEVGVCIFSRSFFFLFKKNLLKICSILQKDLKTIVLFVYCLSGLMETLLHSYTGVCPVCVKPN